MDGDAQILSIVMPAYNAAAHIPAVLERMPHPLWREVRSFWIINDGSTDTTGDVIEQLQKKYPPVKIVTFPENQGYGNAVREGLRRCRDDGSTFAVCLHSDGQYPPESIPEFLQFMQQHQIDILQGSRHADGTARAGGMPFYKFVAGKVLTRLENRVFDLSMTDYHSGFIVYSKRALTRIPFEELSYSFDFDIEMIASARARNLSVTELAIPTRYADEESYLNPLAYGLRILRVMLRYRRGYYAPQDE